MLGLGSQPILGIFLNEIKQRLYIIMYFDSLIQPSPSQIYIFLWFWLIILICLTVVSIICHIVYMFAPSLTKVHEFGLTFVDLTCGTLCILYTVWRLVSRDISRHHERASGRHTV